MIKMVCIFEDSFCKMTKGQEDVRFLYFSIGSTLNAFDVGRGLNNAGFILIYSIMGLLIHKY